MESSSSSTVEQLRSNCNTLYFRSSGMGFVRRNFSASWDESRFAFSSAGGPFKPVFGSSGAFPHIRQSASRICVSRRLRELGIRIVLGAQRKEVLQAALGRPFKLLAFWFGRWIDPRNSGGRHPYRLRSQKDGKACLLPIENTIDGSSHTSATPACSFHR